MRFLAIFQICDRQSNTPFQDPIQNDDGIHIDAWTIQAGLDPDQKAGLEIHHQKKRIGLAADVPSFAPGKKHYRATDASILVESSTVQRATDTLPQAAR